VRQTVSSREETKILTGLHPIKEEVVNGKEGPFTTKKLQHDGILTSKPSTVNITVKDDKVRQILLEGSKKALGVATLLLSEAKEILNNQFKTKKSLADESAIFLNIKIFKSLTLIMNGEDLDKTINIYESFLNDLKEKRERELKGVPPPVRTKPEGKPQASGNKLKSGITNKARIEKNIVNYLTGVKKSPQMKVFEVNTDLPLRKITDFKTAMNKINLVPNKNISSILKISETRCLAMLNADGLEQWRLSPKGSQVRPLNSREVNTTELTLLAAECLRGTTRSKESGSKLLAYLKDNDLEAMVQNFIYEEITKNTATQDEPGVARY
jgi:hypothetical protein